MPRTVFLRRLAAALAFAVTMASVSARAEGDTYKAHMDNGVKLFTDHNYPAAIAEFEAAYELRPNPSPLVNIALCDKELFRYPKAIAALRKAIAAHGDTMDAGDRKAAEDAIKEMLSLLGKVHVEVTPKDARVTVDGDTISATEPVLLGPGTHRVAAHADGYASAEEAVTVASGREQTLKLALVAEKGAVTVDAPDPRLTISVDDQPVGQGHWSGLLAPGTHVVRMYGASGAAYGSTIVVNAGVPLLVTKDQGGVPLPPSQSPEPTRRGLYVLGMGSMLFAATHPPDFPGSAPGIQKPDYGAGYGLRAGFQVNKWAAFELSYEHSSIYTYAGAPASALSADVAYYRIIANRVAGGLRLISAGDTFRFAGSFGGGITADQVYFHLPGCPTMNTSVAPCYLNGPTPNHVGVDAFALLEAGLEVDIDHVLVDFGLEAQLQSTGNLEAYGTRSVFGSLPLINLGPALRIGYRFW